MGGDTYRYGNFFSSSPAVGFWAIMAVTGSVALLTLGKKRIWSPHNHENHHNHHYHHVSARACCCKRKTSDSDDDDDNGVQDDVVNTHLSLDCDEILGEKILEGSPQKSQQVILNTSQQNFHHVDDDKKMPKKALQSSLVAPRSGKEARRAVSKKVRFAPDVVDPTGDGREYRSRNQFHSAHINEAKPRKQENKLESNSLSPHRSNKSLASKTQTLAKPSLPENRMLLYGGMHRYRTLMALHWS